MHILMCNDDGILADGLRQLATYLESILSCYRCSTSY